MAIAAGLVLAGASADVVVSGSMAPAIGAGDVVVLLSVRDPAAIQPGAIVAYQSGESVRLVLHRVVERVETADGVFLVTKGDANEDIDPWPVPVPAVAGVYAFHVPAVGNAVLLARSKIGILLFIIFPLALMLVYQGARLGMLLRRKAERGGTIPPAARFEVIRK